jgi:hypothetical protein
MEILVQTEHLRTFLKERLMDTIAERRLLLRDAFIASLMVFSVSLVVESSAALYGPIFVAYSIYCRRLINEISSIGRALVYLYFFLGGAIYFAALMFLIARVAVGYRKRLLIFSIVIITIGIVSYRVGDHLF